LRRDTSCGELHFRQSYRTMTVLAMWVKDIMQIKFRQGVFGRARRAFPPKPVLAPPPSDQPVPCAGTYGNSVVALLYISIMGEIRSKKLNIIRAFIKNIRKTDLSYLCFRKACIILKNGF